MHADLLLTNISQLATPRAIPQRGTSQGELAVVRDAALAVRGQQVCWAGPRSDWPGEAEREIDLGGRAVVPGLIDPHTHAVWAGDRLADFEARVKGESYEAILARGGGIRSTVRATADASIEELVTLARPRLQSLVRSGATTVEIKSGYGLSIEAELRMLRAIRELQREVTAWLVPTLLIHVPPTEGRGAYLREVREELIPLVAREQLAVALDVFVEREAFSVREAEELLDCAVRHGLRGKLHADQFHPLGGTEMAAARRALSVDHLEASGDEQLAALAASDTVATLLPGVTLHLGLAAGRARALLEAGAIVALGTDLNPGSSPLFSAQLALALGVRLCGMTPAEALVAMTANAAYALDLHDRGVLAAGRRADFLVLESGNWRDITYTLGGNPVSEVWIGGRRAG
ncbi:imidazolonepropionase [Deinococcus peraridilitoris]|uniref:Imidazolonepropionase n=1 Tax=Deinococcus peraridilitoris (strain DSM 19664 / LMG 22246 / CIP 109416 / KR-200) TaxID=937777 RepID=L0A595_DEIPD|nr:imidazolonepropionase [Deinococcus peraridilitoris]AFZ69041.1 imidazolonepropionase [Deinococcus peraridilitoris DSM 19664]